MKLDAIQNEIVYSNEPNLVVVAGAGSGKTRVLTERVRRLMMEDQVPPHNIVAITFTNMAADELKERLGDIPGIGDAFIGTIHSFANRIYKTSGITYEILNSESEQRVYYEVLSMPQYKELSYRRWIKYHDLKKKLEQFLIDEAEVNDFLYPSEQDVLRRCSGDVSRILKRDNIIDFEELLKYATEYFISLGAKVEHLFVDELQDINRPEYRFMQSLNADNYFYVGDDWQSIYGWKGGDVSIFKALTQDPNYKTYFLNNNYRNGTSITEIANLVIQQAKSVIIPKLVCNVKKDSGNVYIHTRAQISVMLKLLSSEENLNDWFILTRTNKESFELNAKLEAAGIKTLMIKKSNFTLAEIKEALSENSAKILTVHSAKGLEAKKVILYGNFPIQQPQYLLNVEERKVMYVGITRAQEELHIFN